MKKFIKVILATLITVTTSISFVGCSSNNDVKKDSTDNSASVIKTISTKYLKDKLGNNDWLVVDTRTNDAFNGWKVDGVTRGGHIKGATDFAANWLTVEDKEKDSVLAKALVTKNITKDKNVVLYDANGKDAVAVAKYLKEKGITNIYTYDVKQWAADNSLPMEAYANYQMLVPPSFVNDLVNGKKPETYTNNKYKIFEVAWGEESKDKDYIKGHIKGAVHINTDEIESAPLWSINSDAALQKFAEKNGLTPDTTVVLYGPDPMASFRIAAIAKYIGVKDVRVLNGGTAAFRNAGYKTETISNAKQPISSFGAIVPVNKNYIVDINKTKEILADKANSKLVDVRSWDEYIGKISGYSDLKFKGRPAGSTWGHAGSDANHLQEYRNIDNTMRNSDEILAMWKEQGITPDQRLSFFCGSGWRAAEVLTYADVMGLKNISLYSNGWYEWSANPKNPVETGEPKSK
ncbi:thiosulfate sulfurtransferase [Clostridium bowmanii]|uniref:sulfurtransferase n=1 Tax=Clostridium bowmanii TaxID=132925 RepID=UPI001C0BE75F|nr:rhodanese-like domain-containing protein [Clostridium bowmanii]MBU3190500.1 thiosulfate sulfurtransferase [Clostridium bowmanii]MCA1074438.1 thiosulfate sulfurtransferase [Clostridium bowmanii]